EVPAIHLLPLGAGTASQRAGALREAAAGKLLDLYNVIPEVAGSGRLYSGGSDTGSGVAARRVSGIWAKIANPNAGNADSGQSFGRQLRRIGRALPGTKTVCEGPRSVRQSDCGAC